MRIIDEGIHGLFKELVQCIEKGIDPAEDEVQQIIERHVALSEKIYRLTKDVYQAMAQLYVEHPEFRKQLDQFHPRLAEFIAAAMKIYAKRKEF